MLNKIEDIPVINDTECNKCHKVFSEKKNAIRHMKTCSGLNNKECQFCKKILSSIQYKNKHELLCKEKGKSLTINNNNTVNNNTVNTVNTDNTVNNIDNSINITVFNADPRKTTKFDTHHITPNVLIQIFKQSMNNDNLLSSKLLDAIWENVNNRCIIKPNMKTNFSKVYGINGSWVSGLDIDIFPKYLKDGYKTSKRLINKYRPELLKTICENNIDKAYYTLDDMETIDMDDKPLTREYLIEDNFFRGIPKDECEEIQKNQMVLNEQIDEYQRNYKRYKCKASDNAKLLA
jgi:hypothetical protein